jgi:hypothetical protein
MKHSNTWFALILIAWAFLLGGAKLGNVNAQINQFPTARSSQNEEPKQDQTLAQEPTTPSAVLSIATASSRPSSTGQGNQTTHNSQSWSDWFWQNLTGFLLVLVGIWAAWIAIGTLDQIAEQTQAAVIAANAGRESADTAKKTFNDLERPWIFARLHTMEGFNRIWEKDLLIMQVRLQWSLRNYGRSPAFVFSGGIQFKILPVPILEKPDYGNALPPTLIPLAQGLTQRNRTFPIVLTPELHRDLLRGDKRLMFFGFIQYRDTFNKEHVSRWCATFKLPLLWMEGEGFWWEFEGPADYTEYT